MYFEKLPQTYYTLDNRKTVQIVTNILTRVVFNEELKNNLSAYYLYNIQDGDTPENLAYQLYGDSNLHWVILHLNEILDPYFEWPVRINTLKTVTAERYNNTIAIHHYEDNNQNVVTGNVTIYSSNLFTSSLFEAGDVVLNYTNYGKGFINSRLSNAAIQVTVTEGGFLGGDRLYNVTKGGNSASNIFSINNAVALNSTPVTNYQHDEKQNETNRTIKILKPQFVERVIREFDAAISKIND